MVICDDIDESLYIILIPCIGERIKNCECKELHEFLNQRSSIRSRCCKLVWCRLNQSRRINIPHSQGIFSPAFASILSLCFCLYDSAFSTIVSLFA